MHRHPRISPAIFQVSITGPYYAEGNEGEERRTKGEGPKADTPSRRRIFVCEPKGPDEEEACARRILSTLMRRAYRRPAVDADFRKPMELYREARAEGGFDAGIEMALAAVLVNPQFLFRIEPDPPGVAPHSAYCIPDVELASRLSFFLWSSIPDDELLNLAIAGKLHDPAVLEQQTRRMLKDPKADSLATNFGGQ
jgi:hypothetical protein